MLRTRFPLTSSLTCETTVAPSQKQRMSRAIILLVLLFAQEPPHRVPLLVRATLSYCTREICARRSSTFTPTLLRPSATIHTASAPCLFKPLGKMYCSMKGITRTRNKNNHHRMVKQKQNNQVPPNKIVRQIDISVLLQAHTCMHAPRDCVHGTYTCVLA